MPRIQAWLAPFTWEMVTAQNAVLCHAKGALHKPTSDGHSRTRELWLTHHTRAMPLEEAVDLCRRSPWLVTGYSGPIVCGRNTIPSTHGTQ